MFINNTLYSNFILSQNKKEKKNHIMLNFSMHSMSYWLIYMTTRFIPIVVYGYAKWHIPWEGIRTLFI